MRSRPASQFFWIRFLLHFQQASPVSIHINLKYYISLHCCYCYYNCNYNLTCYKRFTGMNCKKVTQLLIVALIMLMQLLEIHFTVVYLFFQATRKRNKVITGMFTTVLKQVQGITFCQQKKCTIHLSALIQIKWFSSTNPVSIFLQIPEISTSGTIILIVYL